MSRCLMDSNSFWAEDTWMFILGTIILKHLEDRKDDGVKYAIPLQKGMHHESNREI